MHDVSAFGIPQCAVRSNMAIFNGFDVLKMTFCDIL